MNGWIRLWIFTSLVWVSLAGAISIIAETDYDNNLHYDVVNSLGKENKSYFQNNGGEESAKPEYEINFSYENGGSQKIIISLLSDASLENDIKSIISDIVNSHIENKSATTYAELIRIEDEIRSKNRLAKKAYEEYLKNKPHVKFLFWSKIWVFYMGPPLFFILIGIGISWVISGFRRK